MNTNMKELTLEELEQVTGGSDTSIGANTIIAYQNNRVKGYNPVTAAIFAGIEGFIKGFGRPAGQI